jgi:hypothetical protein
VKIFPGKILSPGFIGAGTVGVGMDSKLITKKHSGKERIFKKSLREAMQIIQTIQK